jgi:uncharacterized membrane protein
MWLLLFSSVIADAFGATGSPKWIVFRQFVAASLCLTAVRLLPMQPLTTSVL